MNRDEWIKSLNPGDKVANEIKEIFTGEKAYEFLEIKKITPKGNIILTNGVRLNSDGFYKGTRNWANSRCYIEPITKEILEFEREKREYIFLQDKVRELADNFDNKKYNIDDLRLLKEILERGESKEDLSKLFKDDKFMFCNNCLDFRIHYEYDKSTHFCHSCYMKD